MGKEAKNAPSTSFGDSKPKWKEGGESDTPFRGAHEEREREKKKRLTQSPEPPFPMPPTVALVHRCNGGVKIFFAFFRCFPC
jgi:hypothetical protein